VRDLDSGAQHLRGAPGCHALLIPRRDDPPEMLLAQARWLQATFDDRAAITVELLLYADDTLLVERLDAVAEHTGLPLVAAGCRVRGDMGKEKWAFEFPILPTASRASA
jgi:error-prone DNA polymerase